MKKQLLTDGLERFLGRAVILGRDRRKVVGTPDEAKLIASQWLGDRHEELRVLPTRLDAQKLAGAEALDRILTRLGLDFDELCAWLPANYKRPAQALWDDVIEEYKRDRERVGISDSQITNVAKAARRLAASTCRAEVGNVTRDDVEILLNTLAKDASPATYNGLLGDLGTFIQWLCNKRYPRRDCLRAGALRLARLVAAHLRRGFGGQAYALRPRFRCAHPEAASRPAPLRRAALAQGRLAPGLAPGAANLPRSFASSLRCRAWRR